MKCQSEKVTEFSLSSYRRKRQKQTKTFNSGSGADEIFEFIWFAFKQMTFWKTSFCSEKKNT